MLLWLQDERSTPSASGGHAIFEKQFLDQLRLSPSRLVAGCWAGAFGYRHLQTSNKIDGQCFHCAIFL